MDEIIKSYLACLIDCNSNTQIKYKNKLEPTIELTVFVNKEYRDILQVLVNLKEYNTKIETFKYASRNKCNDKICCNLYNDNAVMFLNDIYGYLHTTRIKRIAFIIAELNELYKTDTVKMDTVNSNNSKHLSVLKHINSDKIDILVKELETLN